MEEAMTAFLSRLFLTHPRAVDESYVEHLFFALWFAGQLALAAAAALCHAVLPFTCERTASAIVARLYARTHNRGR
jgi:hypothetical protein